MRHYNAKGGFLFRYLFRLKVKSYQQPEFQPEGTDQNSEKEVSDWPIMDIGSGSIGDIRKTTGHCNSVTVTQRGTIDWAVADQDVQLRDRRIGYIDLFAWYPHASLMLCTARIRQTGC